MSAAERNDEEAKRGEPSNPCVMVIFGAAGDLTKRKLIPALYNLAKDKLLSANFAVIGFARRDMSTDEFREKMTQDIRQYGTNSFEPELWNQIVQRLYYVNGHFEDDEAYARLKDLLAKIDGEQQT